MKKVFKKTLSIALASSVILACFAVSAFATTTVGVSYSTHVQNIGWQAAVADGTTAGTTGQSLRVEALKLNLTNAPSGASIAYQVHVQDKGWVTPASKDGTVAGTVGESKRIEAIAIALGGLPGYSVQYRVHVQNIGWTSWGKDGSIVGTTGKGLRIEAIEVKIVGAATLSVLSVTPINATQAIVMFSQPVAGGTDSYANDTYNYSIGYQEPSTAVLASNGLSVLLTFPDATALTGTANAGTTNAAVVIDPIRSASDSTISTPRYVSLITYKDSVKPTATSIVASTNATKATQATITFSEPIQSMGSIKIDGVNVSGSMVSGTNDTKAIFTIDLAAGTTHTVQFFGLTDKVSNVADLFSQSFTVTVDSAKPTVVVAPSADADNAFTLTFNKDMTASTVTSATLTVVDEILGNSFGTATVSQPDTTNNKVFLVTSSQNIFASKTARTFSVLLPATMTDSLGNSFSAATQSVTLTKDATKPVITNVYFTKDSAGKVADLIINTDSALSAASLSGLSVVDSNGVLCTGSTALGTLSVSKLDGKSVVVGHSSAAMTGKFTFTFAAGTVKDKAVTANESAATVFVVDFGSSTSTGTFTIPAVNYTTKTNLQPSLTANVFTVNYGTAVKGGTGVVGSATDPARYTVNGSGLPAGTTITLDGAKQTALITVPAGTIAKTDTAAIFYINGTQDTSGNTVVPVSTTVQINDNIKPVLTSAVLNSDNSVTVGFSETLTATPAYATDMAVYINGSATAISGLTVAAGAGADAGKYVINGLAALVKYTAGTGTFLDIDGTAGYNAASDILLQATVDKHTDKLTDFNTITAFTVKTPATPSVADASNNALTGSTTITIK